MFGRRKKVKGDEATQLLQKQGAYSMSNRHSNANMPHGQHPHPYEMNHEDVKEKKIYHFWGGVKYTVIFTMLLFWIPPFGQMIAGYIGGRKAGSSLKGMFATLIPVAFLFFIFGLSRMGIFSAQFDWIFTLPESGASMASGLPLLGKVAQFSTDYIRTFVQSFGFGETWLTPYILTVIFGYLGGIISSRHQKELEVDHRLKNMPTKVHGPASFEGQGEIPLVMGKKPDGWEE